MKHTWLNDGEPDDDGDYIAVIENAAGQRISTFKGKTYKEVADALLQSQANANREISRLRRPDHARIPQPLKTETKELTSADKLRLSTDITDPDKVVEAVTEIVTHAQGASPRDITTRLAKMTDEQRDLYYKDEAVAFVQDTPDYYPVQQNRDKLFAALKDSQLDLTRNNLRRSLILPLPRVDHAAYRQGFGAVTHPPPHPRRLRRRKSHAQTSSACRGQSIKTDCETQPFEERSML